MRLGLSNLVLQEIIITIILPSIEQDYSEYFHHNQNS